VAVTYLTCNWEIPGQGFFFSSTLITTSSNPYLFNVYYHCSISFVRNTKLVHSAHRFVTVAVESQMEEVEQPLHEAARRGNLDFMQECLKQGVSGTGLDKAGNTPLYWASHAGHVDCVRELLALPRPAVNVQVSGSVMGQLLPDQASKYRI
jgi:hypothetical protein